MKKAIVLLAVVSALSILYFSLEVYVSSGVVDDFYPEYAELAEDNLQSLSHEQLMAMAVYAISEHKKLAAVSGANVGKFRCAVGILSLLLVISIAVAWWTEKSGCNLR